MGTPTAALDRLTPDQLASYASDGYLRLDSHVEKSWLVELRQAADEFVEQSRSLTKSTGALDLEPTHTTTAPRLRRLTSPFRHSEVFRKFTMEGPPAELAMQILGGPVRFHHSKLNYKWSGGGEEIKWHQDIQFWPHTDFSPLTIGVYLDDVDPDMGPMGVVPGSHCGPLYDLYADDGSWAGAMSDADISALDLSDVVWLDGAAGSMTVHNCCTVHGSESNNSTRPRPLLLQTYSAVDSYPVSGIGANGVAERSGSTIIGGHSTQVLDIGGRRMRGAPDWSGRNATPTIFGSQISET